jgi:hypothetical protein
MKCSTAFLLSGIVMTASTGLGDMVVDPKVSFDPKLSQSRMQDLVAD